MHMRSLLALVALLAVLAGGTWSAGCLAPEMGGGGAFPAKTMEISRSSDSGYTGPEPTPSPAPKIASGWAPGDEQKVIRTASITLEVRDVMAVKDSLQSIAAGNGGYIGSLSLERYSGNRLSGYVVIRVPAASFDHALSSIAALGTLRSQSVNAEDVTEEYVDLQARRAALANQRTQYQRIMEKAGNVSEILEVQEQIERVQVEIDRIDGRLKYLDSRIDYATISVSFREPEPVGAGGGPSFTSVINEGIAGFLSVTAALVIILISVIPLVILALVAYAVYRWWKGRRGGRPEVKKPE